MNTMLKLPVQPLTRAAFARFGEVIEADADQAQFAINGGTSQRFHDLAKLDAGMGGKLIVSIFRAQPRTLPFPVRMMERHPKASQAFMPLSSAPYLVVVAEKGELVPDGIQAFIATGRQGVNFAPGTWHHPLLALNTVSDFLVIDRDDPHGNCDERPLAEVLWLDPEYAC